MLLFCNVIFLNQRKRACFHTHLSARRRLYMMFTSGPKLPENSLSAKYFLALASCVHHLLI